MLQISRTFQPGTIDEIQRKAATGIYEIRGYGTLRERRWATFDDLTFFALLAHPHSTRRLSREVLHQDNSRDAARPQADRTRHPDYDYGHELGSVIAERQNSAGERRGHGRFFQHHRRWRDASGGARQ